MWNANSPLEKNHSGFFFDTPNRVRAISHGEWHQIKHLAPSSPISIASLFPLPESGEKKSLLLLHVNNTRFACERRSKKRKERGKRRVGPLFYQRWEGADGSVRPSACNIAHWAEKGGALLYFRNGSGGRSWNPPKTTTDNTCFRMCSAFEFRSFLFPPHLSPCWICCPFFCLSVSPPHAARLVANGQSTHPADCPKYLAQKSRVWVGSIHPGWPAVPCRERRVLLLFRAMEQRKKERKGKGAKGR